MFMQILLSASILQLVTQCQGSLPSYWNKKAADELNRALNLENTNYRAKNVMFFIGDGMGISTLTPTRIFKGELGNFAGERELLSFEKFPHVGLVKTYTTDQLVADSAGTATAFLSGIKTKAGMVGVDDRVERSDCSTFKWDYAHDSFLTQAIAAGKSVGLVTTTRVTHATPASTYAHSPDRNWENDVELQAMVPPNLRKQCLDIATQLVHNASDFNVILGGGRREFMMQNETDPEDASKKGKRNDRNLINLWRTIQKKKGRRYKYIYSGAQLRNLNTADVDYLFGMFANGDMDYELDRRQNNKIQPSLDEMVQAALRILKRNDKGFVLFVEAGRIDHGHHATQAKKAIFETIQLDTTVENAVKAVNLKDTLIMTTADHSHVFTYGSYHRKGAPIFGKATTNNVEELKKANDKLPYTYLLYANGPGAWTNGSRENLTNVDTQAKDYRQQAIVPLGSESHGGEDVGVYARGPMSHLIHGVHEQNYLAHVIMYSACLGQYSGGAGCPISSAVSFLPWKQLIALFVLISLCRNFALSV